MKVAVIGAGASGLAASIEAVQRGAEVILIDANPNAGRKLSATGSGRCNLSNTNASADRYHSSLPDQLSKVFQIVGFSQLLDWFEDQGVFTTATEDGWVYPVSFSAQNVTDILQARLKTLGVKFIPHSLILDIQRSKEGFLLFTQDKTKSFFAERVIIATGGPAAPQLGARENMPGILKHLGHTILAIHPALSPLLTDARQFFKLQGVRLDADLRLLADGKEIGKTIGNIIFTSWGINGPGVMDLSWLVSGNNCKAFQLEIDFLPLPKHAKNLIGLLKTRHLPLFVALESFFPSKLVRFILEQNRIAPEKTIAELELTDLAAIQKSIHHQIVAVKGTRGFKDSQLSTGGIPLSEIDVQTMQSKIIPGLALAGEVLEVNGPCGGYNLHWAFISGIIAGRNISI